MKAMISLLVSLLNIPAVKTSIVFGLTYGSTSDSHSSHIQRAEALRLNPGAEDDSTRPDEIPSFL